MSSRGLPQNGSQISSAVRRYLERRSVHRSRPLVAGSLEAIVQVVVIPVLAERLWLPHTLADLAACDLEERARTLVLCVVNNRAEPSAATTDIADNQRTLKMLDRLVRGEPVGTVPTIPPCALRLAYVDASSPGRELGPKEGVGAARCIGLDHGLAVLANHSDGGGLLLCLDADTRVSPDYLSAVSEHHRRHGSWAAVVEYEHPIPEEPQRAAAIIGYEIFLRSLVLGLGHAGSPYAYHAIGSTMLCHSDAYVAVSGMNRRQAGEDYYFLQQLAKTGRVDRILSTVVRPSARVSHRVPFGTGASVRSFVERGEHRQPYHPYCYEVIRRWLAVLHDGLDLSGAQLLAAAGSISPLLRDFLAARRFEQVWHRLQDNASSPARLLNQAHRWFDAFTTLKLIHHLRDNGYPSQPISSAIPRLLQLLGRPDPGLPWSRIDSDISAQRTLLRSLRELDRARAGAVGLGTEA